MSFNLSTLTPAQQKAHCNLVEGHASITIQPIENSEMLELLIDGVSFGIHAVYTAAAEALITIVNTP